MHYYLPKFLLYMCEGLRNAKPFIYHLPTGRIFLNDDILFWLGYTIIPRGIQGMLVISLTGDPFKREKKLLWVNFIRTFSWSTWMERNNRIFNDKGKSMDNIMEPLTYLALNWCKNSTYFHAYNLSSLMATWRCFL